MTLLQLALLVVSPRAQPTGTHGELAPALNLARREIIYSAHAEQTRNPAAKDGRAGLLPPVDRAVAAATQHLADLAALGRHDEEAAAPPESDESPVRGPGRRGIVGVELCQA